MDARLRSVELLDAKHVPHTADIAQFGVACRFVPQRDRSLLDHEDLVSVRLALPEDVLVRFVELHAPARGELEEVALLHRLERRVLLEEIGYTKADGGRFHAGFSDVCCVE